MNKLFFIFIMIITLGCNDATNKIPTNFDFGKTENGSYTNEQQVNNIIESGSQLMSGDDPYLNAAVEAAKVNTAYLLTVFKHQLGAAVEFNPSFMIIAENTENLPGIKVGKDYLYHAKKMLTQTQMGYEFEKDMAEKRIDSELFHTLIASLDLGGKTITQEYNTTVKNGFSLSFVCSYTDEDERAELFSIIDNIKFD